METPNCMYEYRYEHEKPVVVDICSECRNYIFEGEEYYYLHGKNYCSDCMEGHKKEAEREEMEW